MKNQTQIIKISPLEPDMNAIHQAADLIQKGQLVAFPTETVYGLGADAFNSMAVQTIFSVKQRPSSDPLIVHIQDINEINLVAQNIPDIAMTLANHFWPGPLTFILEKHSTIPLSVTAGGKTVAVRLPAHPIAQLLIKESSCPIAAPSANRFSRTSPTLADHVYDDLCGKIPLIIDSGPTDIGIESTVIDLTQSPPRILRPGGVPYEELLSFVPDVLVLEQYLDSQKDSQQSPGQLFKHYSPNARLLLFSGNQHRDVLFSIEKKVDQLLTTNQTVAIMMTDEDAALFNNKGILKKLGSVHHLDIMGKKLFASMRAFDSQGVDYILVKMPPKNGLGRALQDRLIRAADEVIQ